MRIHQDITSLSVHPKDPSLLCSTSHDHTARIYDLRLPVAGVDEPIKNNNDPFSRWPGKSKACLAGPAFGLRANDGEGIGLGRCIAVLVGGASGGHQAAVLNAVRPSRCYREVFRLTTLAGFSPCVSYCCYLWRKRSIIFENHLLIGFVQMDNSVKLWPIPSGEDGRREVNEPLRRAEKPLFSSSRIHSSHVLSITW